ncbi:MAG: bifunctional DNA primase/polymerase [Alphaproteobacteria bacterium]|nr:bifunctional DNA primase/polymerase [Alphaproteobacteria bacterium]
MSDFNRTRALRHAKRLMKEKLACFPVERPRPGEPGSGKKPLTRHGFKDATKDPETFEALCTQYPEFNIGIATGAVSSTVVLDIDPRNGGHNTLEAFETQHGKLPSTWTCRTGGGGLHMYFRTADFPIPKDNAGWLIGPGVDVLGEGAYAVAAPSLHESDQAYEWLDGLAPWQCKLACLPRKVRRHIKAAIDRKLAKGRRKPVMVEETVTSVTEGSRNATFFQKAARMRHVGMSEGEIHEALMAINANQGDGPWLGLFRSNRGTGNQSLFARQPARQADVRR